jgi:hypothetical protein
MDLKWYEPHLLTFVDNYSNNVNNLTLPTSTYQKLTSKSLRLLLEYSSMQFPFSYKHSAPALGISQKYACKHRYRFLAINHRHMIQVSHLVLLLSYF